MKVSSRAVVLAVALVAAKTSVAVADLCLPAASTIEGIAGPPLWYGSSLARIDFRHIQRSFGC